MFHMGPLSFPYATLTHMCDPGPDLHRDKIDLPDNQTAIHDTWDIIDHLGLESATKISDAQSAGSSHERRSDSEPVPWSTTGRLGFMAHPGWCGIYVRINPHRGSPDRLPRMGEER